MQQQEGPVVVEFRGTYEEGGGMGHPHKDGEAHIWVSGNGVRTSPTEAIINLHINAVAEDGLDNQGALLWGTERFYKVTDMLADESLSDIIMGEVSKVLHEEVAR